MSAQYIAHLPCPFPCGQLAELRRALPASSSALDDLRSTAGSWGARCAIPTASVAATLQSAAKQIVWPSATLPCQAALLFKLPSHNICQVHQLLSTLVPAAGSQVAACCMSSWQHVSGNIHTLGNHADQCLCLQPSVARPAGSKWTQGLWVPEPVSMQHVRDCPDPTLCACRCSTRARRPSSSSLTGR